jgi:hypothetical protein
LTEFVRSAVCRIDLGQRPRRHGDRLAEFAKSTRVGRHASHAQLIPVNAAGEGEGVIRGMRTMGNLVAEVAHAVLTALRRRRSEAADFTCGECSRNQQCGLPPSKYCEHRLIEMAERSHRQARWPAGPSN